MGSAISKDWLPEILEINVSQDLIPEFQRCQAGLLSRIAAVRAERDASSIFFCGEASFATGSGDSSSAPG